MHIRSILAIARKDAIDILLNKNALFSLLTPIFLAVLFLVISTLIGTKTSNILIYDPGNSRVDQVVTSFVAHPLVTHAGSVDDVAAAFGPNGAHKSSSYAIGLIVPANFDADLQQGKHPQLSLYINGDQVVNQDNQLLQRLVTDYASALANPQPIHLSLATINPPTSTPIFDISGIYIVAALLTSFIVGTSVVPGLLVEEKEKKTLRMLMVSPASFTDIVLGKLLVGLGYQLALSVIVIAIQKGFVGDVPMLLLFVVLGSGMALMLGLLAGSIFQTTAGLGGFMGIMSIVFTISGISVGPLGMIFTSNPAGQVLKLLPTYYIADGAYSALQHQSTFANTVLDMGVVLGTTVVLLVAAVWFLRRQAAVVAAI